jgi:hypothetical protein
MMIMELLNLLFTFNCYSRKQKKYRNREWEREYCRLGIANSVSAKRKVKKAGAN